MRCAEGGDVCRRIVYNSTKRGAASQQPRKARHLRVGAAALGGCASAVCHRCSAPRAARAALTTHSTELPPWSCNIVNRQDDDFDHEVTDDRSCRQRSLGRWSSRGQVV